MRLSLPIDRMLERPSHLRRAWVPIGEPPPRRPWALVRWDEYEDGQRARRSGASRASEASSESPGRDETPTLADCSARDERRAFAQFDPWDWGPVSPHTDVEGRRHSRRRSIENASSSKGEPNAAAVMLSWVQCSSPKDFPWQPLSYRAAEKHVRWVLQH